MSTQPAPTRPARFGRHQVRGREARRQNGALDEALTEFAGLSSQLGIEVAMPRLTAAREKHLVAVLQRAAAALSQALQQRGMTTRTLPQHL